jgi:hypothetical protein
MATNKKFNVRHGLSAGTGATQRDIVSDVGEVLDVGVLTNLTTVTKTNVVSAINEINDRNVNLTVLSRSGSGVVINAPTAILTCLDRSGVEVQVTF